MHLKYFPLVMLLVGTIFALEVCNTKTIMHLCYVYIYFYMGMNYPVLYIL